MLASGNVDYDGIDALLAHVQDHVQYLVVMGTTGENATLTAEEQRNVLSYILQRKPLEMPLVYGIGGNNTEVVVSQARQVLFGVDAILSVCPYYNRPTQEGLIQHFSAIANASPVPVILYNVPARTGSNLSAESTLALAANYNIIGIKEASGNLEHCMEIAAHLPEHFSLISGDDLLTVPMTTFGASGVISVLANVIPAYFSAMVHQALIGDYATAKTMLLDLLPLNSMMYAEGNPAGAKVALSCLGICQGYTRLPLVHGSRSLTEAISQELIRLNKRWPSLIGR